jgi:hypothetical protein
MSDRRIQLKSGQIDILELLYTYRFGSRQLLAESLGIKAGSSLHERLGVLIKHGYIAMRLEKRLKLVGMPAAYHLTSKGLRTLQAIPSHEYIDEKMIKASYKDTSLGQAFMTHTLEVYKYTNILKQRYGSLRVFLRRDMSRYSYFPSVLPDAFLSLSRQDDNLPRRFFLDLIPASMPRYQLERKLMSYFKFFEAGGWEKIEGDLPALLILTDSVSSERRLQKLILKKQSLRGIDEP